MAGKSHLIGLVLAACSGLLVATCAAAQTEVISTAPTPVQESAATPAPVPTGAQISAWGREGDDGSVETDIGDPPGRLQPRAVHGEVTAGLGSSGYREVSGTADLPVGDTGDLVVAGSRSSFDGRGFKGGRQSLSVGLFLNGSKPCLRDRRDATQEVGGLSQAAPASPDLDAALGSCSVGQGRSAAQ